MEASLSGHGRRCAGARRGSQLHHHLRWGRVAGGQPELHLRKVHMPTAPGVWTISLLCLP